MRNKPSQNKQKKITELFQVTCPACKGTKVMETTRTASCAGCDRSYDGMPTDYCPSGCNQIRTKIVTKPCNICNGKGFFYQ